MKVILIGNYKADGQESMERFANMIAEGFKKSGIDVACWRPNVILGLPFTSSVSGVGKWFGYIDKWILFPFIILFRRYFLEKRITRFHICDHSNAPYLSYLPKGSTVITCHDVIAIRAGLGYSNTYVSASRMGRLLQKKILSSLSKAEHIAAVSNLTLYQLKELTNESARGKNWQVIHNGFNANFSSMEKEEAKIILAKAGISTDVPFLLHVGSNLARKNRRLLLEMIALLGNQWHGRVCFAGKALDQTLLNQANNLGIGERVMSVVKPDHTTLQALYSFCEAFVFPSLSEGFGWPVIEAQACGAPVIASNIEPMPEIGGDGALYADPANPITFAEAFLYLQDRLKRDEIIQKGFCNTKRFQPEIMVQEYLKIHGIEGYDSQNN